MSKIYAIFHFLDAETVLGFVAAGLGTSGILTQFFRTLLEARAKHKVVLQYAGKRIKIDLKNLSEGELSRISDMVGFSSNEQEN